jgi:hypothetical protein
VATLVRELRLDWRFAPVRQTSLRSATRALQARIQLLAKSTKTKKGSLLRATLF